MTNPRSLVYLVAVVCIAVVVALYAWFPISSPPMGLADHVVVYKAQHKMTLFRKGQEIRSYCVSIGRNPHGPKTRAGDHRTPEGHYVLDRKNVSSRFHLAMHVSYPNEVDRAHAATEGVAPGGDIMVHGIKNGLGWVGRFHRWVDWTDGCIAMTNPEMDQFAQLVPEGTPIEIEP